jgi:hypothetical protein
LAVAWTILIGLPGVILGVAPLLVSLWIGTVSWKASVILTGIRPVVLLPDRIDLRGQQIADDSSATQTESKYNYHADACHPHPPPEYAHKNKCRGHRSLP